MALFGPSTPPPDLKDALIEELRADKARLIEENQRLRDTLIAMADAKAYYMMNPKGMRERLAQGAAPADPGTAPTRPATVSFPTNNPSDYRNHIYTPGKSFADIEKAFKEAAAAEVARITGGSGEPVS